MRFAYLTGATEGRRRYGTLKNESEDAQDFIAKKIKILREEGMDEKQAVAVAYKYAREKGYKVPANENEATENSSCPICKDPLSDHDTDGRCDDCGNHCG